MTADDILFQRVQIAQDQTVETTPSEARTGERDPVPEPLKNKHMMVLLVQIHGVPAAVRAVQAAVPVRIQAAVKPRLHHRCRLMEAIKTAQKDRKFFMVLIPNWKGWLWNQSGIDFNDTLVVIF